MPIPPLKQANFFNLQEKLKKETNKKMVTNDTRVQGSKQTQGPVCTWQDQEQVNNINVVKHSKRGTQ